MKIIVNPHDIKIDKTDIVNEGEYHITQLNFEFSKEYADDLVKKAIFIGNDNKAYETIIDNNICNIPAEILVKQQSVFLGVYAYKITGSELVLRYSPSPVIFPVIDGSYRQDSVPSEEITPSQFEQYQQALQNGLTEVNAKLQEVINTSETVKENGTYAKEQGDYAKKTTDELVNKAENGDFDGATFTPSVSSDGDLSWSNDKGLDNPTTVNIKGQKGDTGEPFTISKTYPSVEAMNADFDNMEVGDYVMIASSVNDEDNAKLYVKTDTEWVFITDFSGAIGIQGEPGVGITTVTSGQSTQQDGNTVTPITVNKTDSTQQTFNVSAKNGTNGIDGSDGTDGVDGVTPNLQIGTVTTLEPNEQATVTRTGTDEEPLFNFGIPKGQQGEQGIQGIPGEDGQPGQDGADGKDATINGQNTVEITTDNNITLDQQENVLNLGLNSQLISKQDAEGTDNTFDDGLESPLFALGGDGKSEQIVTSGANVLPYPYPVESKTQNGITFTVNKDGSVTLNGRSTAFSFFQIYAGVGLNQGLEIPGNYISGGNSKVQIGIYHNINNTDYPQLALNNSGFTEIDKNTYNTGYIEIRVNPGLTFNNETIFPMLSNEQNIPWEPYTGGQPSPSPDYEQPINSIEGSLEFDCNDNKGSSNQVTFDLGQEKLRSVGDVKDELVVDLDTGDYYKVENVGEVVFDGSDDENWKLDAITADTEIRQFSNLIGNVLDKNDGIVRVTSNYFKGVIWHLSWTFNNTITAYTYGNLSGVRLQSDKFEDVEQLKQWLSTNNTIVDYVLQTPTTKKLGTLSAEDLAKLKTFYGHNNVTVNTNLGLMNIRFTYGLDIKKYVDNKIAQLSEQLIKGE